MKKERKLGIARETRRYDLPLNKASGTGFLVLLIGLMTFLAMLALSASFTLSALTEHWSSGLENHVTVEIPAAAANDSVLTSAEIFNLTNRIDNILTNHPSVITTHVMSAEEIKELVKPWLGDDLLLNKVPLPGLISVEIQDTNPKSIKILENKLQEIAPKARIDTHEEWLTDLLRFTGALQFAAIILTLVIGLTTVTAIAGAIRSRMAVYHDEVELLHLMGAKDSYISRQFQRHSLILGFQGALTGVIAGSLIMVAIGWVSGEMEVNLLPDFSMNLGQITILSLLPFLVALIATVTARQTVLKVLGQMP